MAASANAADGLGRRIAYVDGLRALAVLLVVASHAAKWDPALPQGWALQAWMQGTHGVDLFFVLSGFCLSYPILRSLQTRGWTTFDIAGYMARRIVRIVPPYYFAMAVLALVLFGLPHLGWEVPGSFALANLGWLDVGKQAIFADRHIHFINPSFWTLAIEWRWYFLFPLALWLWTRSVRAFLFVVACCAAAAALTSAGGFDLPVLPAFLLGIAAAEIELRQAARGRLSLLLFALALCVAIFSAPSSMLGYFMQVQTGWQVAAFFLVVAAGSVPALRSALAFRPLVWVGIASYSIYLVHEPLIATIEHNTRMDGFEAAGLGVLAGIAFWFIFERPFMENAIKKRLVAWLQPWLRSVMRLVGIPHTIELKGKKVPIPVESEAPVAAPTPTETLVHSGG